MLTLAAVSFIRSGVRRTDPSSWPQNKENKFPSTSRRDIPQQFVANKDFLTGQRQCPRKSVTGHYWMLTLAAVSFTRSGVRRSDASSVRNARRLALTPRSPVLLSSLAPCHPLVPTPVWLKLSQSALAYRQHHERGGVPRPQVLAGSASVGQSLYVIIKHSWSTKTGYFDKDLPLNHLALANSTKIKQTLNDVVKDTFNWASSASWNGNNAPLNI